MKRVQVQPAALARALCHRNTAALPSQPGCRHSTTAALSTDCARQGRRYKAAAAPGCESAQAEHRHSHWDNLPPMKMLLQGLATTLQSSGWISVYLHGTELCTRAQPTLAVSDKPSQWVNLEQACPLYGPFPCHFPECIPKYPGIKLSSSVKS